MYTKINSVEEIPANAIILKHSTTCPISAAGKEQVDRLDAEVILVIVQDQRELSNAIAEKYGVKHESPQLLVIKDGKVTRVFNHYEIKKEAVEAVL